MTPRAGTLSEGSSQFERIESIVEQIVDRLQADQSLELSDILAAYPDLEDDLRPLLPAIHMMVRLGGSAVASPRPSWDAQRAAALPYERLGDFRLIRELGRGGMGVVYEAEQISLSRRVAIKVSPLARMLTPEALLRFQIESRAAGALRHPNIVSVFAVGQDQGLHFYAMSYIDGQTLAQVIAEQCPRNSDSDDASRDGTPGPPDTCRLAAQSTLPDYATAAYFRAVARIGIQVAEALDHAHRVGVVHRDIKPSNLLVDGAGTAYVTDFGLAHIAGSVQLTRTGELVGTLRYMSPEQAAGRGDVVDGRSDIYSLGATLYELASLAPAFGDADPSKLLKQIAFEDPVELRKRNRQIPGEFSIIVAKAMSKRPEERYQTAASLAEDLRAFVELRPIRAKAPTPLQRAAKWSRRHQTLVAVGALLCVVLSAVLGVSAAVINGARMQAVAALEEKSSMLYVSDLASAFEAWSKDRGDEVQAILARQGPAHGEPDRRGLEWRLLHSLVQQPRAAELIGHEGAVREAAVFPDGARLASVGDDGTLRIWDATAARPLKTVRLSNEPLHSVAVSPDGRYVASGSNTVYLCDAQQGFAARTLFRGESNFESLAFSHDGGRLAAGARYAEVCLMDLTGKLIGRVPTGARMESLEFMPQSTRLLSLNRRDVGSPDAMGFAQVWTDDLARVDQEVDYNGNKRSGVTIAKASPCGNYVAAGQHYRSVSFLYHLPSRAVVGETPPYRANLMDLAYSPNGDAVAIGYQNGVVQIFDVKVAENASIVRRPKTIRAHVGAVTCTRFLKSGQLVTAGADGAIRIWDYAEPLPQLAGGSTCSGPRVLPVERARASELIHGIRLSRNGSQLAYWTDRMIYVFDAVTGREIDRTAIAGTSVADSPWSPNGNTLVYGYHGRDRLEVIEAGKTQFEIAHGSPPVAAAFSPNGCIAVIGQQILQVCRGDDGAELFRRRLSSPGLNVAFSRDGRRLAYAEQSTVVIIDTHRGRTRRALQGAADATQLAFSPDGQLLATGHGDGHICVWETATGVRRAELTGHEDQVRDVAFSPDGDTLISASYDGAVRLWSLRHARSYGILWQSSEGRSVLSLSADGRHLAIGGRNDEGTDEVQLWELRP